MREIPGLMTDKEAARLYRLEDIGVCLWGYWGVERPGQPKLAGKLAEEALLFSTGSSSRELQTSLLHRDIGKGRILLSLPSLRVVSLDLAEVTEKNEGPVLVAIEGTDQETWEYGVWLYRLVRRIYPARGKGGKPGQVSWKIVANWLREEPGLFQQFVELLVERKLRRWEQEQEGIALTDKDRKWARQDALLEIKRGLARAGLQLADLKKSDKNQ
jgi:hypothetical protein